MAVAPAAAFSLTTALTTAAPFIANMGASYLLGRLTAQDGPRLDNLQAAGGEYGVAMPRIYGVEIRGTGIFIAQADIKETKHSVEDYSEIVGALTGAAAGFMIAGPVGAAVGAVAGGLLGFATPDQHFYTYSDTFALLIADRTDDDPIDGVSKLIANGKTIFKASQSSVVSQTLDGDGKLIRRKYGKNRFFKSLTIYGGHTSQTLDPILASKVSEESAYVFSSYMVIEDLQLATFGNSVPPIEAIVQVKAGQTFADIAEQIARAAGIDPSRDLSSTALVGDVVRGYSLTGETTCWDALKPLLPVFAADAAEVSGQVRFYKRSQSLRATIPTDEMGAYVFGDSPPQKYSVRREADIKLPQETALTFSDPSRDYQANTVNSSRSEGDARSNVALNVPVVMTADEAASAAALIHWDAWLGRSQLSFTLTDTWIGLEVGLAYAVPVAGQTVPYRITRKLRGANGIIEVEALSDEAVTYTASEVGTSGTIPDDESTLFPDTRLVLMDMPILQDEHDDYGFYIVQSGSEPYWTRGYIQASTDGGTNWVTLIDQPVSAVVGDVTGTLAAGTTDGLDDTLDTTTVLTVELLHDQMALENATDAELDAYKNFAFVGKDGQGEYLQFKTATQTGPTTWELTDLRRGRRGTDWAIATHTSGEEFALLGGEGVFRLPYTDTSQWGNALKFRGVTLHQDEDDADEIDFTNTGEGKRPFSPINVEGSWDGSNNLTITWDGRPRMFDGSLGEDDRNEYEVEILSGTGRIITVSAAETTTYTALQQTSDGITPGDNVSGRIKQNSDVNDGRWRNFTFVGPNARKFDSTVTTFDVDSLTWDSD